MTLNPEEYNKWIDKHLRGELMEEEQIAFERTLGEDPSLAKMLAEMKEIQAGIRQSVLEEKWALMEQWDDEITGDPDGMPEVIHAEHNNMLLVWLGAAALIVLAAIFMWPEVKLEGKKDRPNDEYEILLKDDFETLIVHQDLNPSDSIDPYTKEQREAYDLFVEKDFTNAIPQLQFLWDKHKDSIAYRYLGWSYVFLGDDKRGEEILKSLKIH